MRRILSIGLMLGFIFSATTVSADFVNLVVDPASSSTTITVATSDPETSAVSGTSQIDLNPPGQPFGTAQITQSHLILDDGLNFSFLSGLVTASTSPGDIVITLLVPGPAGNVSAANEFDQLGNTLQVSGSIAVSDPLNLVGGSQTYDLADLDPAMVDFLGVSVSRIGNEVTTEYDFSFTQEIDAGGVAIPVTVEGNVVASGVAIPEPGMPAIWVIAGLACGGVQKRRFNLT